MSVTEQPVQHDEYDGPWKEILEHYLELFFAFFFPHIHAQIDWERGYVFLDKELDSMTRDAEIGRRVADKLVQVWTKSGTPVKVFIHIEVQNQKDTTFDERMFVYNYRIFDDTRGNVVSLAVLGDEHANWRPDHYHRGLWGCEVSFTFPVVKLLDYRKDWDALERAESAQPVCADCDGPPESAGDTGECTGAQAVENEHHAAAVRGRIFAPGYQHPFSDYRLVDEIARGVRNRILARAPTV